MVLLAPNFAPSLCFRVNSPTPTYPPQVEFGFRASDLPCVNWFEIRPPIVPAWRSMGGPRIKPCSSRIFRAAVPSGATSKYSRKSLRASYPTHTSNSWVAIFRLRLRLKNSLGSNRVSVSPESSDFYIKSRSVFSLRKLTLGNRLNNETGILYF